jgi:hypothetical protein
MLLFICLLGSALFGLVLASSPFGKATDAAWNDLLRSVDGRAPIAYPWEAACFVNAPTDLATSNLSPCEDVQQNYLNRSE